MAHFRGTIQGYRGEASRLGSEKSGLDVTANGWNIGVTVYGRYDVDKETDVFDVYLTGGSNHALSEILLGRFTRADLEKKLKRKKA